MERRQGRNWEASQEVLVVIHATDDASYSHNLEAELARPALGHELFVNGKGLDKNGKQMAKTELMLGLPPQGGWGCPCGVVIDI